MNDNFRTLVFLLIKYGNWTFYRRLFRIHNKEFLKFISSHFELKSKELLTSEGDRISRGNRTNGIYLEWFKNGQLAEKSIWKDGKKDGLYERWYENGQPSEKSIWKDGKLDGLNFLRNFSS
jgi:antitoxin component YwqK of YwqJK toxin-antitoxin module